MNYREYNLICIKFNSMTQKIYWYCNSNLTWTRFFLCASLSLGHFSKIRTICATVSWGRIGAGFYSGLSARYSTGTFWPVWPVTEVSIDWNLWQIMVFYARPQLVRLKWVIIGVGEQFCDLIATFLIGVVTFLLFHAFCPGDIFTYLINCLTVFMENVGHPNTCSPFWLI